MIRLHPERCKLLKEQHVAQRPGYPLPYQLAMSGAPGNSALARPGEAAHRAEPENLSVCGNAPGNLRQPQVPLGYSPYPCLHSHVASAHHLPLHLPSLWAKCILVADCEVTGKEVKGFSNTRLQPTNGYEIHLIGQDQNFISFSLRLPSLLFLRVNHLRAFLGPLCCALSPGPVCLRPHPALLHHLPQPPWSPLHWPTHASIQTACHFPCIKNKTNPERSMPS